MFKNLMIYHITDSSHAALLHDHEALEKVLAKHPETNPEGSQWRRLGFGPAMPSVNDNLVFSGASNTNVFALYIHERQLPAATIRKHIAQKAAVIEEREGRKPYRKELAEIKDVVVAELLPKAFIKDSIVLAMVVGNYLVVDASSAKKAEDLLDNLRYAIGTLAVRPICLKVDPSSALTSLMRDPSAFPLLKEAGTAKLTNEAKSVVSFKDVELGDEEPQQYLDEGFRVVELALILRDDEGTAIAGFKLNDKLIAKGVKFTDIIVNQTLTESEGDNAAWCDATIILFADVAKKLVEALDDYFSIDAPEIKHGDIVELLKQALMIGSVEVARVTVNGTEVYRSPELGNKERRELIDDDPEDEDDETFAPRKSTTADEDDEL